MGQLHVVEQGECLSSIAARFGFLDWRVVWNDSQNEDLRAKRPDPNVLYPGDVVFVPTPPDLTWSLPTGQRHRIVIKGPPPETLRLKLLDELDRPRKGVKYELVVSGKTRTGETDDGGELVEKVASQVKTAQLFIGEGDGRREYQVQLGGLDPADTVSGVQARLLNLGFNPGPLDGKLGPRTLAALNEFQGQAGLDPTDQIDAATAAALTERHGR